MIVCTRGNKTRARIDGARVLDDRKMQVDQVGSMIEQGAAVILDALDGFGRVAALGRFGALGEGNELRVQGGGGIVMVVDAGILFVDGRSVSNWS